MLPSCPPMDCLCIRLDMRPNLRSVWLRFGSAAVARLLNQIVHVQYYCTVVLRLSRHWNISQTKHVTLLYTCWRTCNLMYCYLSAFLRAVLAAFLTGSCSYPSALMPTLCQCLNIYHRTFNSSQVLGTMIYHRRRAWNVRQFVQQMNADVVWFTINSSNNMQRDFIVQVSFIEYCFACSNEMYFNRLGYFSVKLPLFQ